MKIVQPGSAPAVPRTAPSRTRRRTGITTLIVVAALLLGAASPARADRLDFTGYKIGIGVGIGAIAGIAVAITVVHSHHTLSGCVTGGPSEFTLQTSDAKTYTLQGMAGIKVGDRLKFHGSKVKNSIDGAGNPVFRVENLKKDYGPCHITPAH
jgi:hypothetical protein